jgi:hypothetical protein
MRKWNFIPSSSVVLADIRAHREPIPGSCGDFMEFQGRMMRFARPMLGIMGLSYVDYYSSLALVQSLAVQFRSAAGEGLATALARFWLIWELKGLDRDVCEAVTCGLYCLLVRRLAPSLRVMCDVVP